MLNNWGRSIQIIYRWDVHHIKYGYFLCLLSINLSFCAGDCGERCKEWQRHSWHWHKQVCLQFPFGLTILAVFPEMKAFSLPICSSHCRYHVHGHMTVDQFVGWIRRRLEVGKDFPVRLFCKNTEPAAGELQLVFMMSGILSCFKVVVVIIFWMLQMRWCLQSMRKTRMMMDFFAWPTVE